MMYTNSVEFDAFSDLFPNKSRFFPISPGSKTPLESGWQTTVYAVDNLSSIMTFEEINIGYRIADSDLIIDIDVQKLDGQDPDTFINVFIREWKLESSLRVRTPSGGVHIYLKKDPSLKVRVHSQRYGKVVEFKSGGTYVVVPGSKTIPTETHVGGSYTIDHPGDRGLLAPDDLLSLVRKDVSGAAGPADIVTPEELTEMLYALNPADFDDNDSWLKVAMAVHSGSGGDGLDEFVRWCRAAGGKYDTDHNESQVRARWASFGQSGGVNVHYLKKLLKERGITSYVKRSSAAEDFADIEPEAVLIDYRLFSSPFQNYWAETYEEEKPGKKKDAPPEVKEVTVYHPIKVGAIFDRFEAMVKHETFFRFKDQLCLLSRDKEEVISYENEFFPLILASLRDSSGERLDPGVSWKNGVGMVTKKEFGMFLLENIRWVRRIRDVPCWPISGDEIFLAAATRYENVPIDYPTDKVEEFLDFFNFSTKLDRAFGRSFVMSLLWNTTKKPAFIIGSTSREGQNTGKTTFVQKIAQLITGEPGNAKTYSVGQKSRDLGEQLIAHISDGKTIMFLADNKGMSQKDTSDLEALITSETIRGHEMYVKQQSLPNTYVFVSTSNYPVMSKDMAIRHVWITLDPVEGPIDPNWETRLDGWIEANREECLKGFISLLKRPAAYEIDKIMSKSGAFSSVVFSKSYSAEEWAAEREDVLAELASRVKGMDSDHTKYRDFDDMLKGALADGQGVNFEKHREIGIPKAYFDQMVNEYMNIRQGGTVELSTFRDGAPKYSSLVLRFTMYNGYNIVVLKGDGPSGGDLMVRPGGRHSSPSMEVLKHRFQTLEGFRKRKG